jgi:hypothetical protein
MKAKKVEAKVEATRGWAGRWPEGGFALSTISYARIESVSKILNSHLTRATVTRVVTISDARYRALLAAERELKARGKR